MAADQAAEMYDKAEIHVLPSTTNGEGYNSGRKDLTMSDEEYDAMKEVRQVVEGVYSARAGMQLAEKYGQRAPIITACNDVLFGGKSPREAVMDLMMRDPAVEATSLEWKSL